MIFYQCLRENNPLDSARTDWPSGYALGLRSQDVEFESHCDCTFLGFFFIMHVFDTFFRLFVLFFNIKGLIMYDSISRIPACNYNY